MWARDACGGKLTNLARLFGTILQSKRSGICFLNTTVPTWQNQQFDKQPAQVKALNAGIKPEFKYDKVNNIRLLNELKEKENGILLHHENIVWSGR